MILKYVKKIKKLRIAKEREINLAKKLIFEINIFTKIKFKIININNVPGRSQTKFLSASLSSPQGLE